MQMHGHEIIGHPRNVGFPYMSCLQYVASSDDHGVARRDPILSVSGETKLYHGFGRIEYPELGCLGRAPSSWKNAGCAQRLACFISSSRTVRPIRSISWSASDS